MNTFKVLSLMYTNGTWNSLKYGMQHGLTVYSWRLFRLFCVRKSVYLLTHSSLNRVACSMNFLSFLIATFLLSSQTSLDDLPSFQTLSLSISIVFYSCRINHTIIIVSHSVFTNSGFSSSYDYSLRSKNLSVNENILQCTH